MRWLACPTTGVSGFIRCRLAGQCPVNAPSRRTAGLAGSRIPADSVPLAGRHRRDSDCPRSTGLSRLSSTPRRHLRSAADVPPSWPDQRSPRWQRSTKERLDHNLSGPCCGRGAAPGEPVRRQNRAETPPRPAPGPRSGTRQSRQADWQTPRQAGCPCAAS